MSAGIAAKKVSHYGKVSADKLKVELLILDGQDKMLTRGLWERIFDEDSVDFLDYYYNYKCRDNKIYAIKRDASEDLSHDGSYDLCIASLPQPEADKEVSIMQSVAGGLVSMLQCNPYALSVCGNRVTADYIVGVATHENCRHQGLMRRLLKKALNDMADEGRAFTFLMPASEDIYTPFGFKIIYEQPVLCLNSGGSDDGSGKAFESIYKQTSENKAAGLDYIATKPDYTVKVLEKSEFKNISDIINNKLSSEYDIFTLKTEKYFEDIKRLFESDGGELCLVMSGDSPTAYFSYWLNESEAEITELICLTDDKEKVIKCIAGFLNRKHGVTASKFRGDVPYTYERSTVEASEDITYERSTGEASEDITYERSTGEASEDITLERSTGEASEDVTLERSTGEASEDITLERSTGEASEDITYERSTGEASEDVTYERRIMARITNVQELLRLMRAETELNIRLKISDELIEANNGTFLWHVGEAFSEVRKVSGDRFSKTESMTGDLSSEGGKVSGDRFSKTECMPEDASSKTLRVAQENTRENKRVSEGDFYELELGIEELAMWIFNNQCRTGCKALKSVKTFSRIFINEIV